MRQYVETRRGAHFPVVLSPKIWIGCKALCPTDLLHPRTFSKTKNPPTISGGKGTTLSRAIYATLDAALAAEVALETIAFNLPVRNLFRDLLDVSTDPTLCRGSVREIIFEDGLWIQTSRVISITRVRGYARARTFVDHARNDSGAGGAIDQRRLFAQLWFGVRTQERSMATRVHGPSHPGCGRFRIASRIYSSESGQARAGAECHGV